MNTRRRKKKADLTPTIALCSYGCGRQAVGSLSIMFIYWHDDEDNNFLRARRDGFNLGVPCCAHCANGTVKISVSIPEHIATPAVRKNK